MVRGFAFFNCSSLEKVTFERIENTANLQKIESGTFDNCSKLEKVAFKNPCHLSIFPASFFSKCTSLKQKTIPSSI